MSFDFYDQFNNYSNVELLRILAEPGNYQAEAVAAADRLLKDRNVSQEEREEAGRQFETLKVEKMARVQQLDLYKEKMADAVSALVVPSTPMPPAKWFKYLLFGFGFIYVRAFYMFVKGQIAFLQCEHCPGGGLTLLNFIGITFLTVIFFMLLKNKRWGWILFMVYNIAGLIGEIIGIYYLYKLWHISPRSVSFIGEILSFVIPVTVMLFLWRPAIADYCGIDASTKRRTIWAGVIFGIMYAGFSQWI